MNMPLGIAVVIPVFDHAATLKDVVTRTLRIHDRVIVVDDGSRDGSGDELEGLAVDLLRHGENRGKGEAILTGAERARTMGMTHIITVDADGQHAPEEIQGFIKLIHRFPDAVIVGRRRFSNAAVPWTRRFGRGFSNFWFRVQTGRKLGDTQSGFRAYPLRVIEDLTLRTRRYTFEIEVLVKAAWAGVPLREVDVSVRYPREGLYVSHYRIFVDNLRLSLLNAGLTMRSMLPWPHQKIAGADAPENRIGLLHPVRSIRTLLGESATPERLAAAGALGVLLGTLPLIGFHTAVILVSAGFLRLSKVAAVTTSQLCMPPLVPALCIETGYFLRHGTFLREISMETLGYQAVDRLYEWFIGSLVLGPVMAASVGTLIFLIGMLLRRQGFLHRARDENASHAGKPRDRDVSGTEVPPVFCGGGDLEEQGDRAIPFVREEAAKGKK